MPSLWPDLILQHHPLIHAFQARTGEEQGDQSTAVQ